MPRTHWNCVVLVRAKISWSVVRDFHIGKQDFVLPA